MKHFYFIVALVIGCQITYAKETEPNNTSAQANTLALNGSNNGKINAAGDLDWWKVTTKADGRLNITLSNSSGKYIAVYLYDNNGTTLLNSGNSNADFNVNTDGLAAGTYYLKVNCIFATERANYTISNALTITSQANDAEPNGTKAQALAFNQNSTRTGHVGYYYNNKRDTADWYKITTTADGQLNLSLTSVNGIYTWIYLYDNDGTTLLNSGNSNALFNINTDGLAAGTYYLKVNCYYNNQFAPYVLSNNLVLPTQVNDGEPNNRRAQALSFNLDNTTAGHVGYYYNNKRDTADWYKITTTADGLLKLSVTPVNGVYTWVYLYDNDGTTLLNSGNSNAAFNINTDGLAPGTYYVKVNCYYNNQFTSYVLSNNLELPAQANDEEPNNRRAQALAFNPNSTTTGHVGYYYNNKRDTADWYRITTTADGQLNLSLTSVNGIYTWMYLYDNDGTTLLNSGNSNALFNINTDGLAAGTYYLKVNCYYNNQFTPYVLSNNLVLPTQANDGEPNNRRAQALTFNLDNTTAGHLGFYYNNKRDTADWYKITTTADGLLKLSVTPVNGVYTWVYLYDNDGTTLLNSSLSNAAFILNTDGLAAGTYYVKVNCYYNNQFTSYTLTNSLITYAYGNDIEPNKRPYQGAAIAANGTTTGHVNFYYNLVKDSADWWKFNYTGTGDLHFTFNLDLRKNGTIPYTWFYVYGDTLAAPIYSNSFNTASNVINLTSLSNGNYYIKIITYYQNDFVTYSIANSSTSTLQREVNEPMPIATNEITIYPNPVSTLLHIQVSGKRDRVTSIILRDVNGKQVLIQSNIALSNGGGLDMDVSKLPGGTYFMQINDINKISTIKKIVIVR